MNNKYVELTDNELRGVVGGKIIKYPYGVYYNTKTGKDKKKKKKKIY